MPYDYTVKPRGAHDHAGSRSRCVPSPFLLPCHSTWAPPTSSKLSNAWATASDMSSTHGPKAGMSATYCISAVWVQVQVPSRTIHKVPLRSQQVQLDDDLMTTDDDCGSLGRPGGGRDLDPGGVRRSLVVPSQQFHCSALGSTQQHFQPARQ